MLMPVSSASAKLQFYHCQGLVKSFREIFHQETYQITSSTLSAALLISLCIALYESFCFQEKMLIKTRYLFHMLFIVPVLTFEYLLFYWLKWYDAPWLLALMILLIDVVIILIEAHRQQAEKLLYANALKHCQNQIALTDNRES